MPRVGGGAVPVDSSRYVPGPTWQQGVFINKPPRSRLFLRHAIGITCELDHNQRGFRQKSDIIYNYDKPGPHGGRAGHGYSRKNSVFRLIN